LIVFFWGSCKSSARRCLRVLTACSTGHLLKFDISRKGFFFPKFPRSQSHPHFPRCIYGDPFIRLDKTSSCSCFLLGGDVFVSLRFFPSIHSAPYLPILTPGLFAGCPRSYLGLPFPVLLFRPCTLPHQYMEISRTSLPFLL